MTSFRELTYDQQLVRIEQILDTLLPYYGLSSIQRTLLQFENNAVYRIATDVGQQLVIRIAAPWGASEQQQRSEMQWLKALRRETSLEVPEPVRNRDGDLVTTIIPPDGRAEGHTCVVLGWVPGEPPEPGFSPALMQQIGLFTAQMHRFAERFVPERDFDRPRWDWERLFGSNSILHREEIMSRLTSQQRKMLNAASEKVRSVLSSIDNDASNQGLIHADLHRDNILIRNSEIAVIDFEDCGFGYYLYDIACILESFNRRVFTNQAERQTGQEALLRGYTQVRNIPSDFDEDLGVYMVLRNMVTLDFILRSNNPNVQTWGVPRIAPLINQIQSNLST